MSDTLTSWLAGRLPDDWFEGTPEVTVDRDEILIVGRLTAPEGEDAQAGESGRIARFREDTREQRMRIAREAEHHFGRKVAWGAVCGETRAVFTSLSVPVMTRLRQPERVVLDTLVESGVARSRSDALAWCVRLVGEHTGDWLTALRDALQSVQKVRDAGPEAAAG
jgi:Arc/MetJ-type ribon-helix-helix transcriptional regulator